MFLGYGLNAPHLCSMQRDKFLMMNHTNEAYLGDEKLKIRSQNVILFFDNLFQMSPKNKNKCPPS